MMPETWLPTCTVVTAETVPVALTVMVTVPRSTTSVRYLSPPVPLPRRNRNNATRTAAATTRARMSSLRPLWLLSRSSISVGNAPYRQKFPPQAPARVRDLQIRHHIIGSPGLATAQGGDVRDVVRPVPGVGGEEGVELVDPRLRVAVGPPPLLGGDGREDGDPALVEALQEGERDLDRPRAVRQLRPAVLRVGADRRLVLGQGE